MEKRGRSEVEGELIVGTSHSSPDAKQKIAASRLPAGQIQTLVKAQQHRRFRCFGDGSIDRRLVGLLL